MHISTPTLALLRFANLGHVSEDQEFTTAHSQLGISQVLNTVTRFKWPHLISHYFLPHISKLHHVSLLCELLLPHLYLLHHILHFQVFQCCPPCFPLEGTFPPKIQFSKPTHQRPFYCSNRSFRPPVLCLPMYHFCLSQA